MSMIRSLLRPRERASLAYPYSIDSIADIMRAGGYVWGGGSMTGTLGEPREEIPGDFVGLVLHLYRANPVAFAAVVTRMQIFAQARFRYRQLNNGEPGAMFGKTDLSLIENPEPTISLPDMLKRASLDADFAGNWFGIRRPERLKRVRPDWVYIVKGNRYAGAEIDDVDTEAVGIIYQAGGPYSAHQPQAFAVGEYAHFAPIPDPLASYRGMSWMTPIIRDAQADQLMTSHKTAYLEHGATPNVIVRFPPTLDKGKALEFKALFEQEHEGALNAFKTVFLGGGADLTVVGNNMQQLDMKAIQGAGETRIALASRVPAVLLQISEGLQGSSLNAGNYNAAKKQFGDGPMRDLWQTMAGALEDILTVPPGAELWYDEARIPFLQEDAEAAATVINTKATAMRTLWDGGAEPDSVIDAVNSGDLTRLKHTGKPSVQLQEGGGAPPPDDGSEPPDDDAEGPEAQARALITALAAHGITADLAYDPNQPRRSDGKWGRGGGKGTSRSVGSSGGGGGEAPKVDDIIRGPSVPIDKWGKGPTLAPDAALNSLLDHKPANVKADDIDDVLLKAAEMSDAADAAGDKAQIDRVRSADLTDLQVSGELDFGGDGLGILRKDMPQFAAGDENFLPEYIAHVQEQNGWKVETGTTQNPHDIAPVQSEISVAKVGGMVRATKAGTMKRTAEIVIAEDPKTGVKMVIDGHHGWAVATAMKYEDPSVTLKATVIRAPARDVLQDALDWTAMKGIARQSISTASLPEKKAAVDRAWEEWAERNPDRLEPQPLARVLEMATGEVRCPSGHLLAEAATPPYRFTCPKCKAVVAQSGRWAVTTDPKVVSFSPSTSAAEIAYDPNQPRKADGKWGRGGGKGSSGVGGAGVPGGTGEGGKSAHDMTEGDKKLVQDLADQKSAARGPIDPAIQKILGPGANFDALDKEDAQLEISSNLKRQAMIDIGADLDAQFPPDKLMHEARKLAGFNIQLNDQHNADTPGKLVADGMLSTWQRAAYHAGDSSSMAVHRAVSEEFGTGLGATMTRDMEERSGGLSLGGKTKAQAGLDLVTSDHHWDVLRAGVRSMHTRTQARLDELGVGPTVTLHRGMNRNLTGDQPLDSNPASSWSTDPLIADKFARDNDGGSRFTMTVPRERILAIPGHGMGCFEEHEAILIRADGDVARATEVPA